ncbi:MAG: ATP-dependent RNA helicase, partial [Thermodesulfobacteriota bacterium]
YRNGRTVLALSVISQAAADQRKGRAGRLGPGKCLRLWGKSARLESYTPPEIVREDPAETVLAAAACGHRVEDLRFPDPPPGQALEKSKTRLQQMGALDEQGYITRHGSSLFLLPLDSQLAHLITAMPQLDTKFAMVDLASALTVQGSILLPSQPEGAVQQLKDFSPEPCDACTLIRLLRFQPPEKLRINSKMLAEARRISVQIKEALNLDERDVLVDVSREKLLRQIIRATPELVYVRRLKRRWSMGNGQDEVEIGSGTRFPEKGEAAIVLDRHSIPGQKGTTKTLTIATCLAPVSFEEISAAGLGEVNWKSPLFDGNSINVTFERIYAGRTIDSWNSEPQGEMLCRAVAELILNNELWSDLGSRIEEDVRAWNLYVGLGFASGQEEDANSWLVKRLCDLGLENSEDIYLLDESDLEFPGIPELERRDFDRRYPRSISLANLELDVEYEPGQKRITLVRRAGIRRSPPKRWELPSWGMNWKIRFKDGNRVVPVD